MAQTREIAGESLADISRMAKAWNSQMPAPLAEPNAWIEDSKNIDPSSANLDSLQGHVDSWKERYPSPDAATVNQWLTTPFGRGVERGAGRNILAGDKPLASFDRSAPSIGKSSLTESFPKKPSWKEFDSENIKAFWDDSFKDSKGTLWQVATGAVEPYEWGGYAEGQILRDGEVVGEWKRSLDTEPSDKAGYQQVEHQNFYLDKTAQGQGFATMWLSRAAERYQAWDLKNAHIETGHDGAAAWPRLGFDISASKDHDRDGNPTPYDKSVYAGQMHAILEEMKQNSGKLTGYGKGEITQYLNQLQQSPAGPPSLPELCKNQGALCKALLRDVNMELSAPTDNLLELGKRYEQKVEEQKPQLSTGPSQPMLGASQDVISPTHSF